MKKLLIISLLLVLFTCSFFVMGYYIMFETDGHNTYTRAVCDGNRCADYEFTCMNGIVTDSKRISGLVVFGDDWVDLREEKENC